MRYGKTRKKFEFGATAVEVWSSSILPNRKKHPGIKQETEKYNLQLQECLSGLSAHGLGLEIASLGQNYEQRIIKRHENLFWTSWSCSPGLGLISLYGPAHPSRQIVT